MGSVKVECPKCRGFAGWVCESHPDQSFTHKTGDGKDCSGAGVPCPEPGCQHSMLCDASAPDDR